MDHYAADRTVKRLARRAKVVKRISPASGTRSSRVHLTRGVALRDVGEAASHADPRTTMRDDQGRGSLDRHATYIAATFLPAPPGNRHGRRYRALVTLAPPVTGRLRRRALGGPAVVVCRRRGSDGDRECGSASRWTSGAAHHELRDGYGPAMPRTDSTSLQPFADVVGATGRRHPCEREATLHLQLRDLAAASERPLGAARWTDKGE